MCPGNIYINITINIHVPQWRIPNFVLGLGNSLFKMAGFAPVPDLSWDCCLLTSISLVISYFCTYFPFQLRIQKNSQGGGTVIIGDTRS